eukprot:c11629_g1_i2.p1 GENE.c11629_g1_i2~~c11629_g1_i2.p1  ORF type:complete len:502 (-),score=113.01 c11629_g1_i2:255-1760(-)
MNSPELVSSISFTTCFCVPLTCFPGVWPIAGSSLLMGTAIGVVIPVMPVLAQSIGLASSEYGLVVGMMGATRLLVNIPLAVLGERWGRKPLLIFGPLCSSFAIALTGLSSSLQELLLWRFVTGVGGGAQMTGAQLYLSDISSRANRARTLAPMGAAFSTGMMLGPAIGGLLADRFGLESPFYFVAAAVAIVALKNHIQLPETAPHIVGKSVLTPPTTQQGIWRSTRDSMRDAIRQWRVLLADRNVSACVSLHCVFWAATSGAQITLLPLLAVQHFDMSLSSLGAVFALMSGVNVLCSQPVAWFSDRWGRKGALVPGALISSVSMGLLCFSTTPLQFWATVTMWGVGNSFFGSTPSAYISDISKDQFRAQALALLRSAGDLGLMLGATLSGVVAHACGLPITFVANAVVVASVSIFFWFRAVEPRLIPSPPPSPTLPSSSSTITAASTQTPTPTPTHEQKDGFSQTRHLQEQQQNFSQHPHSAPTLHLSPTDEKKQKDKIQL